VRDRLTGVPAGVEHESIAAVPQAATTSEFCGDHEEVPDQTLFVGLQFREVAEMAPGQDEQMGWRLRADVLDRNRLVVFVDDPAGARARDDGTEDAGSLVARPHSLRWAEG